MKSKLYQDYLHGIVVKIPKTHKHTLTQSHKKTD